MKQFEQLTDFFFYIISPLSEPIHGYAIMKLIEDTTDGTFIIGPASLYTIIKKLMKENYIELHDKSDGRKKVYILTEVVRSALEWDISRGKVMIEFAEKGLYRVVEHEA